MPKRQILIIKTGFSEFLDAGISTTVSLGDVLICTCLLPLYKNDHVVWLTDIKAKGLLANNPFISELICLSSATINQLRVRAFDVVVNLEKDFGLCLLANEITAKKKYGFYFDDKTRGINTRKRSTQYLLSGQENQRDINKNAFELLYEAVGANWKGQGVCLGVKPKAKPRYDLGFNYAVGSKWPTKAWPKTHWDTLEKLLIRHYSITWQQGQKNLRKYIEWINNCRVLVTNDSLGQAIAQGLGKKVITLYGPTNPRRMQHVPGVNIIASTLACPHMPCFMPVCQHDKFCMDYISPERVANIILEKAR